MDNSCDIFATFLVYFTNTIVLCYCNWYTTLYIDYVIDYNIEKNIDYNKDLQYQLG